MLKSIWKTVATLALLSYNLPCFAAYTLNMSPGVTEISRDIYALHMITLWVCIAIGIIVFSVLFYALIWHRKSRGAVAANFHESLSVEIIWTIIPFIILIAMAWPATKLLIKMDNTDDSAMTIKITGYMWRWHYRYQGEGVEFMSTISTPQDQIKNMAPKGINYLLEVDNPIVVPINKKIRFLTTANDVIHSWWVPQLGIKKDAIPGFINETWAIIDTPGTYRGQCAELCGVNHGFMPIVLIAKTQADFDKWLAQQKETNDESF
ncbi:MAG: cytochrome c oxidase subunit II [Legionellales bacterium]|nr:MAG: cytochrome c oxidase subunit II [Legionellales bacterium]